MIPAFRCLEGNFILRLSLSNEISFLSFFFCFLFACFLITFPEIFNQQYSEVQMLNIRTLEIFYFICLSLFPYELFSYLVTNRDSTQLSCWVELSWFESLYVSKPLVNIFFVPMSSCHPIQISVTILTDARPFVDRSTPWKHSFQFLDTKGFSLVTC